VSLSAQKTTMNVLCFLPTDWPPPPSVALVTQSFHCALSRTMLVQDGATQESEGLAGSVGCCCWVSPSLASLPSTPIEVEAGRRGMDASVLTQPANTCHLPQGKGGGGEVRGAVCRLNRLTVLQPHPHKGRGCLPHNWVEVGRRQVA
jgi:hypothetical protein